MSCVPLPLPHKVIPGGAAFKDGRLVVGQRILEVNAQSLLGASHMDAVRALRGVQEKLTMLVCDGFKPEELEQSMPISKSEWLLGYTTHTHVNIRTYMHNCDIIRSSSSLIGVCDKQHSVNAIAIFIG